MPDQGAYVQLNHHQRFYQIGDEYRPANSSRYPFHAMKVSESFFVPESDATRRQVTNAAYHYAKKIGRGWKFAVRSVEGGTACIRIS